MWHSILASVALMFGCGSRHEAPPSEGTHGDGSQQSPAEPASVAHRVPASASTAAADASVEVAAIIPPSAAAIRAAAATGTPQCSENAKRCTLRVTAKGIYVDGSPESQEQAVTACKRTVCAVVAIEDNAPADEWHKLQIALIDAGIPILMRGVVNDTECLNNPLAKGCN